jgi:inhibitor of cysteine peptidase
MLSLAGCGGSTSVRPIKNVTATVSYMTVEGGFFGLRGDDGVTYDPTRLDPAFAQDGLRVRARLQVRDDLAGTHMVGPIVDILEISRL